MCTNAMIGAVAGYSKAHYYLGTPEFRDDKPKKRPIKRIRPKKKKTVIEIKPLK